MPCKLRSSKQFGLSCFHHTLVHQSLTFKPKMMVVPNPHSLIVVISTIKPRVSAVHQCKHRGHKMTQKIFLHVGACEKCIFLFLACVSKKNLSFSISRKVLQIFLAYQHRKGFRGKHCNIKAHRPKKVFGEDLFGGKIGKTRVYALIVFISSFYGC